MTEDKTIYLIDGSAYIFRAYYGIRPLSTRDGIPKNAVIGFARMVGRLLKERKPSYLAMIFDAKEKTFRHDIYDQYKANRDSPPEDLIPQFPLIHEFVDAMNMPNIARPGFEADDVIATLATGASQAGFKVVVVSGDKDLMQLVTDNITLYDPMKEEEYGPEQVQEKFGVPPHLVADVLALAGDTSDNIPGVPKIGPKTAAKLLTEFGDFDTLLAKLPNRTKLKAAEKSILENTHLALLSKRLTVLNLDTPVEFSANELKRRPIDTPKLEGFLTKIEAPRLLRDLTSTSITTESITTEANTSETATAGSAISTNPTPAPSPTPEAIETKNYRLILDMESLNTLLDELRTTTQFAFDLETTSLNAHQADIVGMSFAADGIIPAYIPISHLYLGVPKQIPLDRVLEKVSPLLKDASIGKIGQNLKYDLNVLARYNIEVNGIHDDSMLAAYALETTKASYSMDNLAREYLGHQTITYKELTGTGKNKIAFADVAVEQAGEYAAEDSEVSRKLARTLNSELKSKGQEALYRELELPLMGVLAKMEQAGILVDTKQLQSLTTEFGQRLREIQDRAYDLIGDTINLASPKQLSHLFFEKLNYPVIKKTKTGYSTDQEVLETLSKDYELPKVILEHRMLSKLKSTYVDSLAQMIHPKTKRIHTNFNQTGTATGRLSSTDPNLQNIPIRTEDGKRIRKTFIAAPGYQILAADYSQIELRVMAHLCEDPNFIDAYKRGEDIHTRTAMEILTNGESPTSDDRRQAKAINFGILYGLSEFGLAKQLGIGRETARDFIKLYFSRYPKIQDFLNNCIEDARETGYVTTLQGRQRALPDINSNNQNVRRAAERIAMNTPIQGSAADIIKMAMLRVDEGLRLKSLKTRILLQVHDELVFEVPNEELEVVSQLVEREMSQVVQLHVPLDVAIGTGINWAEAH
ncbi:MAG: DNA polymerase I [Myxococcota bacterium]|nr:DNA polymerase I [Myxococcota bacterium]